MSDPAQKHDERFSYGHYRRWDDDQRWELIDGEAWLMSAPSTQHQRLLARLSLKFGIFLEGKPCEAFFAPYDLLLPKAGESDDEVDTVVQPDLLVFCDRTKIHKDNARGAPDLVIEILSPSTSKKDLNEKFRHYERSGVREYWVVDPFAKSVMVYRLLPSGRFDRGELCGRFHGPLVVASKVLEGFTLDTEALFAELE